MEQFIASYGLYAAYILAGLALLLAIVLPLINAISNPKTLLGTVVGLVGIAIVFFIGYSLSTNEVTTVYTKFGITESSSKIVGGALITMYILVIIALVSIVFTEVTKIFK
ncbi:CDP-diglyceride synthetase [Catalinimonas alkaloidigena]|uniref:hypothetical protein n=1 Tax=Catalinimonas alkaloidigena TaxID=1075417 RepID=UPI002404B88E|nr:hypothetical protein [Catalinimonas alkaloidigena]MDF9801223.1 CDP-diglyceride synthetase [Catalinimonas alkaloidigena]